MSLVLLWLLVDWSTYHSCVHTGLASLLALSALLHTASVLGIPDAHPFLSPGPTSRPRAQGPESPLSVLGYLNLLQDSSSHTRLYLESQRSVPAALWVPSSYLRNSSPSPPHSQNFNEGSCSSWAMVLTPLLLLLLGVNFLHLGRRKIFPSNLWHTFSPSISGLISFGNSEIFFSLVLTMENLGSPDYVPAKDSYIYSFIEQLFFEHLRRSRQLSSPIERKRQRFLSSPYNPVGKDRK